MHSTPTVSRSSAITATSAVTATIAALTLAAGGPHDPSDATALAARHPRAGAGQLCAAAELRADPGTPAGLGVTVDRSQ